MTLGEYLNAANQLTGVSGIESFWVRSALLSAEVFALVGITAGVCLKFCPPFRVYRSPVLAVAVALTLLAWYALVIITSLLLFLINDELRPELRSMSASGVAYLAALTVFVAAAFSPMVIVYLRAKKVPQHGA